MMTVNYTALASTNRVRLREWRAWL